MGYVTKDLNNNASSISFQIKGVSNTLSSKESILKSKAVKYFKYNERNTFVEDNLLVDIPANALYEDIYFEYREEKALLGSISPIYWIHNQYTPLHKHFTISIKLAPLVDSLKNKAVIFSTTDGKSKYAEGGKWNGQNISVKSRSFGGYGVAIDTIKPKIRPINIYQNANMSSKWSIQIKISDDFSGIKSYNAFIDGKWILMEYDAKNNLLTHFFDERTSMGEHTFKIVVKDKVNNEAIYEAQFKR